MPEQQISAELRQRVIERAHGCCEYCRSQAKYATQSLSVEHILARTKGGTTTPDNLASTCLLIGHGRSQIVRQRIAGTTMKVGELVTAQIAYGCSAEEVRFQFPRPSLSQIHSALAYYWDHRDELDQGIARRLAATYAACSPTSPATLTLATPTTCSPSCARRSRRFWSSPRWEGAAISAARAT